MSGDTERSDWIAAASRIAAGLIVKQVPAMDTGRVADLSFRILGSLGLATRPPCSWQDDATRAVNAEVRAELSEERTEELRRALEKTQSKCAEIVEDVGHDEPARNLADQAWKIAQEALDRTGPSSRHQAHGGAG